jgi:tetratricopeptide (TPR) repeat protein
MRTYHPHFIYIFLCHLYSAAAISMTCPCQYTKRGSNNKHIFWLLIALAARCYAAPPLLNADMHSAILASIDCIYNEKYTEGEEESAAIIKKYPNHPAGYFFMAVAIDAWMGAHFSDKREDEFYNYCDRALEKAEKIIDKNPRDEWALFFEGGAEGYKGTYEFRYERWITAFRHGWKGVSILQNLRDQHSEIADIDYGIGCYEYWRCALMKSMWWMPRVTDKRAMGIEKLQRILNNGMYTKASASVALIDIYLNEKKYKEAFTLADDAGQRYPASNTFMFGKARALFGLGEFEESERFLRQILSKAEGNPNEDHAIIAVCHYWLAKNSLSEKKPAECIAECDRMKNYQFTDDTQKMLVKYFDEIEKTRKQATTVLTLEKAQSEILLNRP